MWQKFLHPSWSKPSGPCIYFRKEQQQQKKGQITGTWFFKKITVPPKKDGFRRCQSRQVLMSLYIHTQDAAIVNETNHFFFFCYVAFRFLFLFSITWNEATVRYRTRKYQRAALHLQLEPSAQNQIRGFFQRCKIHKRRWILTMNTIFFSNRKLRTKGSNFDFQELLSILYIYILG